MANNTLSDFPVLTNLDAASVAHVQKELVDYQVTLPVLAPYLAQTAISGADEKTDPVDADMVGLMDSAAAGNALKKFSWANFKAKLKTYFDALYPSANGWITLGLTMTYASADSPTFTATVPGDVTGVLSAGMKLKLTQTTVKYFIITAAPSYASGTGLTTLTLYGGTDYTLDDATISNVYYSAMKAPYGFPLDPTKWRVYFSSSSNITQGSPAANYWYHKIGAPVVTLPIGIWSVTYSAMIYVHGGGDCQITLSTSDSSESDLTMTSAVLVGSSTAGVMAPATKSRNITVTTKTPYYLLMRSSTSGMSEIAIFGGYGTTIVNAVCAYL